MNKLKLGGFDKTTPEKKADLRLKKEFVLSAEDKKRILELDLMLVDDGYLNGKTLPHEIDWIAGLLWALTFMGLTLWTFVAYFYTLYKIFEWIFLN